MEHHPDGMAASTFDTHAPAADTEATKTIAASALETWTVDFLTAGFDKAPGAARLLKITIGGTIKWQTEIPNADIGPQHFPFPRGLYGAKNEALVFSLAAASGTCKGKISFGYR